MPGVVVTVDVTSAPSSLVCKKVDTVICCKLFKVLGLHIGLEEHVEMDVAQCVLLDATLMHFDVPLSACEDTIQSLGDCLRAGIRPVGLMCTLCGAWQVDVGHLAVNPKCKRTCNVCSRYMYM